MKNFSVPFSYLNSAFGYKKTEILIWDFRIMMATCAKRVFKSFKMSSCFCWCFLGHVSLWAASGCNFAPFF